MMSDQENRPLSVQSAPAGWVMVPAPENFPCKDYVSLGACDDECKCYGIHQQLLSSAPPPPVSEREKKLEEALRGLIGAAGRVAVQGPHSSEDDWRAVLIQIRLARAALAGGSHDK